jgi:hypothetical protein
VFRHLCGPVTDSDHPLSDKTLLKATLPLPF